jgi:Flavodoxin
MVEALVVFESMFGNTQIIAKAVADGLSSRMSVDLVEVGDAPTVIGDDVELLVVGGPTHAFGMSRPGTRQGAAKQAEQGVVSAGIGLREWLAGVQGGTRTTAAAAFDTRFKKPSFLVGSAARRAEKLLRKLGFRVAIPAESFFVAGAPGPLLDGEPDRARGWGVMLGSQLTPSERRSAGHS